MKQLFWLFIIMVLVPTAIGQIPHPTDLSAFLDESTGQVDLSWYFDQYGDIEELCYDNGPTGNGYYYLDHTMSTRMSPAEPCQLLGLKYNAFMMTGTDNRFNAEVYGWAGLQPDTTLLYSSLESVSGEDWTIVDVSSFGLFFDGDFVVGFGSISSDVYLGFDSNLNNGRSWDFGSSGWQTWNEAYVIRAIVLYPTGEIAEIEPAGVPVQIRKKGQPRQRMCGTYRPSTSPGQTDDFLSFIVYRDGVELGQTSQTSYTDQLPICGTYEYYVTALYEFGESDPSNLVTVEWDTTSPNVNPDTIRYDDGGFYFYLGEDPSWGTVRFTPTHNFVLRNIYFGMYNPNAVADGMNIYVCSDEDGEPGSVISGPHWIDGPLFIDGEWLDYQLEDPYPTFLAGEDFQIVFGPAPSGSATEGWYLFLDGNGNTDLRSAISNSAHGPWDYMIPGDLIVRSGGEYFDDFPGLNIELSYLSGSPVPPGGGILTFDVALTNMDEYKWIYEGWFEIIPEGGEPITYLSYPWLTLDPGISVTKSALECNVPDTLAEGNYILKGNMGIYPDTVISSSSFEFVIDAGSDLICNTESTPFELPDHYAVLGTYPNPFNPSTTISYSLPEAGMLSLKIFDAGGHLVTTLVDGHRDAGYHEVTFDANGLSSGVYIYQLKVNDFTANGKVILMK